MSFQWKEYLGLAEWLQANAASAPNQEAIYRTAISRAYYAAFHEARTLAESLGFESSSAGADHYLLRKFFDKRADRVSRQIAFDLYKLYDYRVDADYSLSFSALSLGKSEQTAKYAIDLAAKILSALAFLRNKSQSR